MESPLRCLAGKAPVAAGPVWEAKSLAITLRTALNTSSVYVAGSTKPTAATYTVSVADACPLFSQEPVSWQAVCLFAIRVAPPTYGFSYEVKIQGGAVIKTGSYDIGWYDDDGSHPSEVAVTIENILPQTVLKTDVLEFRLWGNNSTFTACAVTGIPNVPVLHADGTLLRNFRVSSSTLWPDFSSIGGSGISETNDTRPLVMLVNNYSPKIAITTGSSSRIISTSQLPVASTVYTSVLASGINGASRYVAYNTTHFGTTGTSLLLRLAGPSGFSWASIPSGQTGTLQEARAELIRPGVTKDNITTDAIWGLFNSTGFPFVSKYRLPTLIEWEEEV